MYKVVFSKEANKQLEKMDKGISLLIYNWIGKNLVNCTNPRLFGKALKGGHKDKWVYRVGSYRILSKIEEKKIIIYIIEVGHRNIY